MPKTELPFQIDPEFKSYIPALTDDELRTLADNIAADGKFLDPCIVWKEQNLLLDGHNRADVWRNLPDDTPIAPPAVEYLSFPDRTAAKRWLLLHQLGRRNLTPERLAYYRGELYNVTKQPGGRPEKKPGQNVPVSPPAKKIAEQTGVAEKTVKRDAKFSAGINRIAAVNAKAKDDILGGSLGISKNDVAALADKSDDEIGAALKAAREPKATEPAKVEANGKPADGKKPHPDIDIIDGIESQAGRLARQLDQVAKLRGGPGSKHAACLNSLNEFLADLKSYRKGGK